MTGLMPSCWGPAFWHVLHSIAMAYEPSKKKEYFDFLASLGGILPCDDCRKHYRINFDKSQNSLLLALDNTALDEYGIFKWVYDLHNLVNEQTGVPRSKWPSYEEVVKKYESFKVSCGDTPGVCGGSKPQRRIKIIEEFGNMVSLSGEAIALIVIGVVAALIIIFMAYKNRTKILNFVS